MALAGCVERDAGVNVSGNAEHGREVVRAMECGVCHTIPGIRGARGIVGPSLERFGRRQFIAGTFPNQPQILVEWLRDPPAWNPRTAMPALGLSEHESRDIAAFLYTLR